MLLGRIWAAGMKVGFLFFDRLRVGPWDWHGAGTVGGLGGIWGQAGSDGAGRRGEGSRRRRVGRGRGRLSGRSGERIRARGVRRSGRRWRAVGISKGVVGFAGLVYIMSTTVVKWGWGWEWGEGCLGGGLGGSGGEGLWGAGCDWWVGRALLMVRVLAATAMHSTRAVPALLAATPGMGAVRAEVSRPWIVRARNEYGGFGMGRGGRRSGGWGRWGAGGGPEGC